MNINGIYTRKSIDENNDVELTITIKGYRDKEVIKELEKGIAYRIALNQVKSKRSIEQNNLMWSLIHEIAIAETGRATSEDEWNIYIQCLEEANAKYQYIACLPEAVEMVSNKFRAHKIMNEFEHNGKTFIQLKVFEGSSRFDSKEMTKLLDIVIDRAIANDIQIHEPIDY